MATNKEKKELTEKIRSCALELGFQKVGFAKAVSETDDESRLEEWLDLGYHGTMNWMLKRKDERADILKYFPEAKSVVSLGMNYYHGNSSGIMKISNYSWGDDYHNLLKGRLLKLLDNIREFSSDFKGFATVDTSPLMEKAWAQRAGLGWIGKHTNLISRDFGSWLFLGELILNCELVADPPFEEDLCGSCSACIDSCPTDAIVEDYRLDARRCISYLTIEHKGELPKEYEESLDDWIFGCDVCQQVCPWNEKFSVQSKEKSFAPREKIVERTKEFWCSLTENDYKRLFKDSPVKRTKFIGLKRNISASK